MPDEEMTIEDRQAMELTQNQLASEQAAESAEEEKTAAKPAEGRYINSGEATLLLAFFGSLEIVQWLLDMIPYAGWIINVGIAFFAGFIFFIWLSGKIAKGAPKKWYKAVYYGAAGSALPIIPGYLGAIIYLYMEDHQLLKKIGGKLGETAGKIMEKI
jgi:hypothetical protein